jgi:DNA repair and recombination protein RAD52
MTVGRGPVNVVNPQMDATRRIGVPGGGSPMANRSGYKPPTFKRSVDGGGGADNRTPLVDLPANEAMGLGDGGDLKRQRLGG